MSARRPAWQVVMTTIGASIAIVAGLWAGADYLFVSEVEAKEPVTGYMTKERAKEEHTRESVNRAESDARLAETLSELVKTVRTIHENQILIGERMRVRGLDRGDE